MPKKLICVILLTVFLFCVKVTAAGSSAEAAVVINADTAEIIYSSNSNKRLPMASTTKIMTALLLCEHGNLQKEITVTKKMVTVEGSSMGLLEGDKVTLHDLLYGMMLASGNDAANTTAYILGGSPDGFAKLMNKRAQEMGLKDTHFVTPSGLDDDEHYTTAYELAVITMNALKNEDFAKAVSSQSATLCYGNPPYNRTLTNHNRLLKESDEIIGVKTGFTKKSGRCLVTAARRDGKTVIAVTLNDPNDWSDHRNLLNYGLSQIKTIEIKPDKQSVCIDCVAGSKNKVFADIPSFKINTVSCDGFSSKTVLPEFLYAPIKKGDKIGNIYFYKEEDLIGCLPITAKTDIRAKEISAFGQYISIFKYLIGLI